MTYLHTGEASAEMAAWLGLIRAEYLEMPGLALTLPQVCRLWRLDPATSSSILGELVDVEFLRQTSSGAYILAGRG